MSPGGCSIRVQYRGRRAGGRGTGADAAGRDGGGGGARRVVAQEGAPLPTSHGRDVDERVFTASSRTSVSGVVVGIEPLALQLDDPGA